MTCIVAECLLPLWRTANSRTELTEKGAWNWSAYASMMFEFVMSPLYQILALISNHVNCFVSGFITNPCPNFNDRLTKAPLKFGHGWAITSELVYMCIITYADHNHDACLPNLWKERGSYCQKSSASTALIPAWLIILYTVGYSGI